MAAASIAVLAVSFPYLAFQIDRRAIAREQALVRSGYDLLLGAKCGVLESDANWDQLVERVSPALDTRWLDDNVVTSTAWDLFGQTIAVAAADDTLPYLRLRGRPVSEARRRAVSAALNPVLRALRARERAIVVARASALPVADHVALATTVAVAGRAYAVLAARIDSPSNLAYRLRPVAPVLLALTDVETTILPELARHLDLPDLRLATSGTQPAGTSVALAGPGGAEAGRVAWTPRRPGTHLLLGVLPALLAVAAALSAALFTAYRQAGRATRALIENEARAKHLALHDQLTGLPNRRLLNERIAELGRSGRSGLALLLIDLDRFKAVNDTFGHQIGDELVVEVARRLGSCIRPADCCARLGGDEFVVVAPAASATEATRLARRIIAALSEPMPLSAATVHVGASVGIVVDGEAALTPGELLRRADLALYEAKRREPGGVRFFDTSMDQVYQKRRALERDFRQALLAGDITLVYQPQYRGPVMTGVEALAHWTHPERGPVAPALIPPLAEECGLIEELGWRVLRGAFADSHRWPQLGIAVNLSAVQLRLQSFLPELEALISEMRVDPRQFEFEITETVLMTDDAELKETLAALRAMGFRLALDDFGTGYCNLGYLRRFPIDKIKIGRSFVATLPGDVVSEALVRTIVRLGRALGVEIAAEGIETEAQRAALLAMGCEQVQGTLTGRPVPAEEIVAPEQARAA